MHLHLYGIARRRPGHPVDYYIPLDQGHKIGWTPDLSAAWCIERAEWAEAVRAALMRDGEVHTFVHVLPPEITFTNGENR